MKALGKLCISRFDFVKTRFAIVHQVHLVDRHNDGLNAQQGGDKTVALGLCLHPIAGINQDNGHIRGRRTGRHITRVLLMSRRVGNDKLALFGREITIRHINGNALLTFRLQAINQQRQVHLLTSRANLFRVIFNGR